MTLRLGIAPGLARQLGIAPSGLRVVCDRCGAIVLDAPTGKRRGTEERTDLCRRCEEGR